MLVTCKIRRYNPQTDQKPYYATYEVEAEPTDRVLDVLNHIKWYQDGTLTFRRSCAHGVCGSDAMRINGVNRLACKVLVRDIGQRMTIEPLLGFRVIRDLVVDLEPFFEKYKAIMPYLINDEEPPERERLQSPEERELYDDTTKCILCAACTTACPPFWSNPDFLGPAALVNAHRFIFDSRDKGFEQRMAMLNDVDGVWRCRTVFNCTDACPRGIQVTNAIEEIKRKLLYDRS
ncbi:succinate dehydrogenase and fumarate reductase iron-sulfur protein [Thermobaculum terrenum ATCC BAA-798]|uniref:succinate dehydrogenase n=1 Tax=Thermobaculum terrenum (strain ATCC BAA-798 / CCMEE 7001 / YNP1) TaxID=525904 RepID=D1CFJ5_THET1|nr:succinate dehydrogenase iron-sulfur subunit [Thermobaculum terrenum]ACZ41701.1 succinate dehydrogenase and fumarate reductase iron-sulfur protein [Thermobaculum terrenum ATCC BAA-798]